MISIAIINLKGGVGKSVTACNLAAELAAKSKSVLVVDLDKQGNTSKFFGVADYDRPCVSSVLLGVAMVRDAIVETAIPAVALLPCDMRMLKANREMIQDTGPRQFYLRNCLEPVEGKYDYSFWRSSYPFTAQGLFAQARHLLTLTLTPILQAVLKYLLGECSMSSLPRPLPKKSAKHSR